MRSSRAWFGFVAGPLVLRSTEAVPYWRRWVHEPLAPDTPRLFVTRQVGPKQGNHEVAPFAVQADGSHVIYSSSTQGFSAVVPQQFK